MNTYSLLSILADGQFHSGTDLGCRLLVSRSTIWKWMQSLAELGVQFDSVRGKGYRLVAPLYLLDGGQIAQHLSKAVQKRVECLDVHFSLDSTNSELQRRLGSGNVALDFGKVWVCLSERQTAGRGRRGRQWVSPFGSNLYFSLARHFGNGVSGLEGMSLVTGIAVVRALAILGVDGLSLKWPNDVLIGHRKLAGILLEMSSDAIGEYRVITGIGINVSPQEKSMSAISQPWVALEQVLPVAPDRNRLAAILITCLIDAIDQFQNMGFGAFLDEWESLDCATGRQIDLHLADGSVVSGRGAGVTSEGGFRLKTPQGVQVFSGGEVSLRLSERAAGAS